MQKQKKTVAIGGIALSLVLLAGMCAAARAPLTAGAESAPAARAQVEQEQFYSGYCGMGELADTYAETINYDHKETVSVEIPYGLPFYSSTQYDDACTPIAGTVLIGYFDRFCENLVPNYKTYTQFGSRVIYRSMGTQMQGVLSDLYSLMGTNSGGTGTTFNGFNSGMSAYASQHGYTYSWSNVWSSDLSSYGAAIESGKPVAVFLMGFSLVSAESTSAGKDVFTISEYTGNHVVASYGYKIDYYYDFADNLITSRTYLTVINGGYLNSSIKYICLNGRSNVAYAISTWIE